MSVSEVSINTAGAGLVLNSGTVGGSFEGITSTGGVNNVSLTAVGGNLSIAVGTLSGASGPAFTVSGGTVGIIYNGGITQSNTAALVNVSGGHASGTLLFQTGTLSASNGTGLQFDNADGTYTFSGTTTLNGGDAGIDIIGGSSGTFSFNSSTSINNPTGIAYREDSSTPTVIYNGKMRKDNNSASLVDINAKTAGSTTFGGSFTISTGTATAIDLTNNTGSTVGFSGGNLVINTTTGVGFNATGGGTVNVTGSGNAITSGTGTALNVVNTTIGASNLTFQSITAGTAASGAPAMGINLTTTGLLGGLIVTGNGTMAGSGGTIQKCTHGVYANSSRNLSLSYMNIINNGQNQTLAGSNSNVGGDLVTGNNLQAVANLTLFTVTNASLSNLSVTGSGQIGINGNSVNGLTLTNSTINSNGNESFESGIVLQNASGTISITGTSVRNNRARHLHIANGSGSMTLNTSSSQYGHTALGLGTPESQQGILLQLFGTSNSTINASGLTIANNEIISGGTIYANGFQLNADNGSPVVNGSITGSTFDYNAAHVFVNAGGTSTVTFNTQNNLTMTHCDLQAINYTVLGGSSAITANLTGTISGNQIGVGAIGGTSAGANIHAIDVNSGSNWSGQMHLTISNNTIQQVAGGIILTLEGSPAANVVTPQVHAKLTGNNISNASIPNEEAIKLNAAVTSANPKLSVCWDVGGAGLQNIVSGNWATGASQASLYLRNRFTGNGSIRLPGYGGSSTDDAAVTSYLVGRNSITAGPSAGQVAVFVSHTGTTPFTGGAACTVP